METHALGYRIREVSIEDAASRLDEFSETVSSGCDVIVVRRDAGTAMALISEEELQILMEEVHILRSARNSRHLFEALEREEGSRMDPAQFDQWLANERSQLVQGA